MMKDDEAAGEKTTATNGVWFLPHVNAVAAVRREEAEAAEISGGTCLPGKVVVSIMIARSRDTTVDASRRAPSTWARSIASNGASL